VGENESMAYLQLLQFGRLVQRKEGCDKNRKEEKNLFQGTLINWVITPQI
jgi:hypothetical protein